MAGDPRARGAGWRREGAQSIGPLVRAVSWAPAQAYLGHGDGGGCDNWGAALTSRPGLCVDSVGQCGAGGKLECGQELIAGREQVIRIRVEQPSALHLTAHGDGLLVELVPNSGPGTRESSRVGRVRHSQFMLLSGANPRQNPPKLSRYTARLFSIVVMAFAGGLITTTDTGPIGDTTSRARCVGAPDNCALPIHLGPSGAPVRALSPGHSRVVHKHDALNVHHRHGPRL